MDDDGNADETDPTDPRIDDAKAVPKVEKGGLPPFEPGCCGADDERLSYPMCHSNYARWPLKAVTGIEVPKPNKACNPRRGPGMSNWCSPFESDAVNHVDEELNDGDFAEHDWANPGKQHGPLAGIVNSPAD